MFYLESFLYKSKRQTITTTTIAITTILCNKNIDNNTYPNNNSFNH